MLNRAARGYAVMRTDASASTGALPTSTAWTMFVFVLLAYSVNAMDRMVFPVLLTDIRAEYQFGLSAAGLQSTVFALGMGVTGIPLGLALRRFGRKSVIVTGTIIFSAATFLTVVSVGFVDMFVWRVASGIGEALQLGAILTVASTAFPRQRGLAIGAVNTAFAVGSVLGPALGVALLQHFHSWRAPMIAFALIGLLLAAVVAVTISPRLTEIASAAGDAAVLGAGPAPSILGRNPIILAIMTALFGLIDFAYIGMYATFLREHHGFGPDNAGLALSLSGLAAFASPLGGLLTDRLDPKGLLMALCVAQSVAGAALFAGPATLWWQCLWSLLFGLIASAGLYVALAACLVRSVHTSHASLASGVFITCIYVAAAFSGLFYSVLTIATSWTAAALIQITGLSLLCAALALALNGSRFAPTASTSTQD